MARSAGGKRAVDMSNVSVTRDFPSPAGSTSQRQRWPGEVAPGNLAVRLELDDLRSHPVRQAHSHLHTERVPQAQSVRA